MPSGTPQDEAPPLTIWDKLSTKLAQLTPNCGKNSYTHENIPKPRFDHKWLEQFGLSGTNERCTEFCRRDEEILKSTDGASDDVHSNAPLGFSNESGNSEVTVRRSGRQNKSKAPSRYGNPVKHSVKLIKSQQVITDLNKAALEAYRLKLAPVRADAN